jgi:hypothetical protein
MNSLYEIPFAIRSAHDLNQPRFESARDLNQPAI